MKKLRLLLNSLILSLAFVATGCNFGANNADLNFNIEVGPFVPGKTSVEQAANMAVGWNLGNTLDALPNETSWGMPLTTKDMIKAVHSAGFKTIRIPVSWGNHVSGSDYIIDSTWLNRVKTIVDWAIEEEMCVIINIHHDNVSISDIKTKPGFALSGDKAIQDKSKKFITSIWTQVGTTFKNYGDNLVFEVLNEPRDIGGQWKGNEWWTRDKEMIAVITDYEQAAVDAIRAVGEKNANRYIMVPGYAASGSDSGLLALYTMPKDPTVSDKLILSAHAYSPYQFAMDSLSDTTFDASDENEIKNIFNYLKSNYVNKGIGVVMGEASASDKNNTNERIKWFKYYFGKAKECAIPVVLWDNMVLYKNSRDPAESHGYFNRKQCTWYFPEIMEVMMETVYGENYKKN